MTPKKKIHQALTTGFRFPVGSLVRDKRWMDLEITWLSQIKSSASGHS